MSGRRMWGIGSKRFNSDTTSRGIRYNTCRGPKDDDLEDIAVVSNADPGQVKYGSGIITANGPRVVPGNYIVFKKFLYIYDKCWEVV